MHSLRSSPRWLLMRSASLGCALPVKILMLAWNSIVSERRNVDFATPDNDLGLSWAGALMVGEESLRAEPDLGKKENRCSRPLYIVPLLLFCSYI